MSIKKSLIYLVIIGAIVLIAVFMFPQSSEQKSGAVPHVLIGEIKIDIEIADTPKLRAQGLSGKESLAEDTGMLFVFEEEGVYPFWMKGMNFPIDIIWIDENYQIVDITKNAAPESYPQTFSPKKPIKYVLEIGAGLTDQYEIDTGEYISM